ANLLQALLRTGGCSALSGQRRYNDGLLQTSTSGAPHVVVPLRPRVRPVNYPALPSPLSSYTHGAGFVRLLGERIVILDGAMGTMIQRYKLAEGDFRGARFAEHARDVKGNNELLSLVKPEIIAEIHRQYLEAGADV